MWLCWFRKSQETWAVFTTCKVSFRQVRQRKEKYLRKAGVFVRLIKAERSGSAKGVRHPEAH